MDAFEIFLIVVSILSCFLVVIISHKGSKGVEAYDNLLEQYRSELKKGDDMLCRNEQMKVDHQKDCRSLYDKINKRDRLIFHFTKGQILPYSDNELDAFIVFLDVKEKKAQKKKHKKLINQ